MTTIEPDKNKVMALKIAEIKLQRINQANSRLRTELSKERQPASNSTLALINFAQQTEDYFIPSIWGPIPPEKDKYAIAKRGDTTTGCCIIA